MAKETSPDETRCLVYKRTGVWHEKVQHIDDFYSKPLVRPADPDVLVEFVSPRFKQHYQVEVARTDIRTLKKEHKSYQVELDTLKRKYQEAELRISELDTQVKTHEQGNFLWQEKQANLSQENLNVRSKLDTLNQQYVALESLQRDAQQQITTQNEQINSLRDRLSAGPNETSSALARDNKLLTLKLKALEDLNVHISQSQEHERRHEFAKLNSTVAEQKNEIQMLKDQVTVASNNLNDIHNLQTQIRDLQQQNASVSAKKQVLENAVTELQTDLAMRDPPSSAQNLAARKEILGLKMQLKELERSKEVEDTSQSNNEQQLSQTLLSRAQRGKLVSEKLAGLGLLASTSGAQEGENGNDGKEEAGSLNFFYVCSSLIDTLDRQQSISANFQDEDKRHAFVQAKIAAQKYLNDLGTINSQLWDPKVSTSSETSHSQSEILGGPVPTLAENKKHPLDTPPLPSAKRVKWSLDKREQDSRESSTVRVAPTSSSHEQPGREALLRPGRCDECQREHKPCIHHENFNMATTTKILQPQPRAILPGHTTGESRSQQIFQPALNNVLTERPAGDFRSQSLHNSNHNDLTGQNFPRSSQPQLLHPPQTINVSPQVSEFPQEISDVIKAFHDAGYTSCYENSQFPSKSLYAYRHLTRTFKVQPWEVVKAPPKYWARDLLQFLSSLAVLLAGTPDPLRLAKTMLERQIESRAATGPDAVLKLGDVKKAIAEWKETAGVDAAPSSPFT